MIYRFASIPRCASRTLQSLGLLGERPVRDRFGELKGVHHHPIRQYADWEKYRWMVVTRDPESWYRSWWETAKGEPDGFAAAVGLKFRSLEEDQEILHNASGYGIVPRCEGLHGWVPADFGTTFPASGLDFYEYCRSVIMDGVTCEPVRIEDLDAWLISQGLTPVHLNLRGG